LKLVLQNLEDNLQTFEAKLQAFKVRLRSFEVNLQPIEAKLQPIEAKLQPVEENHETNGFRTQTIEVQLETTEQGDRNVWRKSSIL